LPTVAAVKQEYLGAVKESSFDGVHEGDIEVALLEAGRQLQQQVQDAVIVPPDHVKDAAVIKHQSQSKGVGCTTSSHSTDRRATIVFSTSKAVFHNRRQHNRHT